MTQKLFLEHPYMRDWEGTVIGQTAEGGLILEAAIFYPQGGGQPGDSGILHWEGGQIEIATTVKGDSDTIVLVPAEPAPLPAVGTNLRQALDWDRRYAHMKIHTALHLLSVVIPLPVSGGAITAEKGRLDFNMPEPLEDKGAVEAALQELIDRDLPVTESWISDAELEANPGLVKTMSVKPPMGAGRVRLVRIGAGESQVDLQPCGGTHVASTAEIGRIRLGKLEKKGRENRRVNLHLVG
ncbi:alanyl-tRNA editing protein [Actibacterium sp. 188UL27-1]|uniref:alanyl-tRNA editing protein n=1 Tax=Actibacterium sp. 188UL27-1 TaxID=2786961 RepID=UPI001956A62B|nr:alanyl-tRNA editing protein [Actibacterium sp. 188UL27-1]MBM7067943.1 alanyl-tRNA editing protein [Actibacterium sp. 188UL27-1]